MTDDCQSGFDRRVPAEWEPVDGVWLAWPHNRQTWPGYEQASGYKQASLRFNAIAPFFADLVRQLAELTPVYLLADSKIASHARHHLGSSQGVTFVDIPTDDTWVRDYGPTWVTSRSTGEFFGVHWRYNAWGGKYGACDMDRDAAKEICEFLDLPRHASPLCLEGGALEFDGDRRLITTTHCLLTDSRNPGWTKHEITTELRKQTGATEIAWIDCKGIQGDDTDGHIDQLARFVDRNNLVVAVADANDLNHLELQSLWRQLESWASSTDPLVSLHPLPIPPARYVDGKRVPESYCNFLRLGPEHLFLPVFGAKSDDHAIGLLKELTGATVHPVSCRDFAWGLGALHCATREIPLGV